jgi:hypothetical protein
MCLHVESLVYEYPLISCHLFVNRANISMAKEHVAASQFRGSREKMDSILYSLSLPSPHPLVVEAKRLLGFAGVRRITYQTSPSLHVATHAATKRSWTKSTGNAEG